jgi:hypothetical protein
MNFFKCANFTAAAKSAPDKERPSVRLSRVGLISLCLPGDLGVKSICPGDGPQVLRVDGGEPEKPRYFFSVC